MSISHFDPHLKLLDRINAMLSPGVVRFPDNVPASEALVTP
jgi:hypothetical protein